MTLVRCSNIVLLFGFVLPLHAIEGVDPIFDLKKIQNDPLDVKLTKPTAAKDGLVVEHVEFTSQIVERRPVRVKGVLAYPRGAKKKPAVFFSMPGMAPASEYWSSLFARKGYVTLTVTLPSGKLPDVVTADGRRLNDGNLTNFAIAQMRGITLLCGRPEVDAERIGIGGSSYGGFFATLIAGADPRIKAGMSFFAGGNHHLGTNLPQYLGLQSLEDSELWRTTVDPAWRLKKRKVPFLWSVAANDHWFHFPAVVQTFRDSVGDKRLAVAPHWAHAFDAKMDDQLLNWFDIYLAREGDAELPKKRVPYLKPGQLSVVKKGGRLTGEWNWSGRRTAKSATLIVSYGHNKPWYGWVHRLHAEFPAVVAGTSASAEIPVPETDLPAVVYGNVRDQDGTLTTTEPIFIRPSELGIRGSTGRPVLNGYPLGGFEAEDWTHLVRTGIAFGRPDNEKSHAGKQCIRMDTAPVGRKHSVASMKLLHVPDHGHRLSLWLRSDAPSKVQVRVSSEPPAHWGRPVVDAVRKQILGDIQGAPEPGQLPHFETMVTCGADWQRIELDCPDTDTPIEGYNLTITQSEKTRATYWIDDVEFRPLWK